MSGVRKHGPARALHDAGDASFSIGALTRPACTGLCSCPADGLPCIAWQPSPSAPLPLAPPQD
eukprot:8759851-Pyramimonas_sp.AAC.1